MTVDLTKIKTNDVAIFRNTGRATIEARKGGEIKFKEYGELFLYLVDTGTVHYKKPHPLDILEIIPAPFDWSKVKQGDAFETGRGEIVYFVANDFYDKFIAITSNEYCNHTENIHKSKLKPRPELNLF